MFAVTITFSVRLGQMNAFLGELDRLFELMANEAESFEEARVLSDPSRPGKALLVQYFADASTFEAYRALPQVRSFDSRVVDMVTNRAISTWSTVS